MAIRYDGNLNSRIRKVVSSFNRKVKRLQAKDTKYLPDTISVKELKGTYDSRKDLLRELESMKRFTKRGAEEVIRTQGGARMTKWEAENVKRDRRIAKIRLNQAIKREQKNESNLRGSVSASIELANLRAKRSKLDKPFEQLTQKAFESFRATIESQTMEYKKLATFKENYIHQMLDVVAWTNQFDKEQLEKLKYELNKINARDFYYKFYRNNAAMQDILDLYKNITFSGSTDNLESQFNELLQGAFNLQQLMSGNDEKDSLGDLVAQFVTE